MLKKTPENYHANFSEEAISAGKRRFPVSFCLFSGIRLIRFVIGIIAFGSLPSAALALEPVGEARLYPDNLFGAAFADGYAVATGYYGAVRVSGDGGSAWEAVSSGTTDLLRRVAVVPGGAAFAVSHRGRILESAAGGRDWRVVHEEPGVYLRDISFSDARNGFAVGHDGLILHTADGGATWVRQELANYTGRDKPRLSGVAALDARHALAVGEFGVVAQTSDGGTTWTVLSEQVYPTLLQVAVSGRRGLAVGLNGTLLALDLGPDGTWAIAPIATGTSQHLLSVAFSPDGRTALIGGSGLLLTLQGDAFVPAKVTPEFPLGYSWIGGVAIAAGGEAIAVGQGGAILHADSTGGLFTPAVTGPGGRDAGAVQTSTASPRVTP